MSEHQTTPPTGEEKAKNSGAGDAHARIDKVNGRLCLAGALPPDHYDRPRTAGITHGMDLREEPSIVKSLESLGLAHCSSAEQSRSDARAVAGSRQKTSAGKQCLL